MGIIGHLNITFEQRMTSSKLEPHSPRALPRGSSFLSLDISQFRSQFAGRTELAIEPLSERSCGRDESDLWMDGPDCTSRSRVDALADHRVPFQVPEVGQHRSPCRLRIHGPLD